jgi:hypothetical protein
LEHKIHKTTEGESTSCKGRRNWRAECNGEVNISHENTTILVWIYDGV